MDGTNPNVEDIIVEYLKGLMAKAEQGRADRVAAPPVEGSPAEESAEPSDEEMMELAQASGIDTHEMPDGSQMSGEMPEDPLKKKKPFGR